MGQEALIIGLGVSGKASAELLLSKGYAVTAVDRRVEALKNDSKVSQLIALGMKLFSDETVPEGSFSLAVLSPGIESSHPVVKQTKKLGIELVGEIELAFRYLPNECVLAVTGSNGKTTTVLLTAHIFNASGKKAVAVGNVGAALSGYALSPKKDEILVVELSSFQLESLSLDGRFDAALILNITPNHLNRHASMTEYANAKLRIGQCLKSGGRLFISRQVEKDYGIERQWQNFPPEENRPFEASCATPSSPALLGRPPSVLEDRLADPPKHASKSSIFLGGRVLQPPLEAIVFESEIQREKKLGPEEIKSSLKSGLPERQNIEAARALCSFCNIPQVDIDSAIKTFRKPPHRIEWVDEIDGVAYYNDSKASNVEAVMHAVELFPGPVVLIAGGVDKGASYAPWVDCFQGKVTRVIVFGQAGEKIKCELEAFFPVERFSTLKEAFQSARKAAHPGETVLLSPGCSSYDQFANFEERGEMFKKMIRED